MEGIEPGLPVLFLSQEWEKRQKTRADETESVTKVELRDHTEDLWNRAACAAEKHRISSAMEEKSSACHVKDEVFRMNSTAMRSNAPSP